MIFIAENNNFLQQQLDLLISKQTDNSIEWQDITDFRAEHFGEYEHRDTIRKGSKLLLEYIDAGWDIKPSENKNDNIVDFNVCNDKLNVQKERMKLQSEKIELNRWLRELSRDELIAEHIVKAINDLKPLVVPKRLNYNESDKIGLLCFGDEHFGIEFELKGLMGEVINSYSPEIFEKRMWQLLDETIHIIKKENISDLRVFSMGDFTDGILRVSQLMKLKYGVVEGTVYYSEFICNWLNELSKYVNVKFQIVSGNHSELRMLGQPKGTFKEENMALVVKSMIKSRLGNNPNFEFIENPTEMIFDKIYGYNILGIHGEVKNMEKAIKDFSHTYNVQLNYLIAGHLHHSKSETVGVNCEVVNVPSIIGIDSYSLSLNKTSNAGATLLLFEDGKGKTIEYSIKLN